MAVSNESRAVVVTTQPCQRHQHLELATLTEMVNPRAAVGLGDWPRPPTDYGYGGDAYRHQHEEAWAAKDLVVGWGLQWWTIGMLISDCLAGQISKVRGDFRGSNPAFRSSGRSSTSSSNSSSSSSGGGGDNAEERSLAKKRKLSDYTLIAALQVLLGSELGARCTSSTSSRRVTFNTVPQVKYVDKCQVLYPPNLIGLEIKRQAFWSKREIKDNQVKWEGHLESYELGRNGFDTFCKCHGCAVDGEDTNF